jgi:hypothetical protein
MAHYAFLDENNIVTEVIVGIDETETIEGLTPEEWYGNFRGQRCVRTSYNGNIRKNYAGIGFTYDPQWNAFREPQPYPSWKLNYETFKWEPPVPMPDPIEGFDWLWGEVNKEWIKVESPEEI